MRSRGRERRGARLAALALLVVLLAACGDDGPSDEGASTTTDPTTAAPSTTVTSAAAPTTGSLPPVDGPFAEGRTPLPGFGEVEVRIVDGPDGEPIVLCVLHAETPEQRQRGLMGVTDESLGGYDGMVFTYDDDHDGAFWMKDTLLALSVAYVDGDGAVVGTADMDPCPAGQATCPSYPSSAPFRAALEVVQGGLEPLGLEPGSAVRVEVGGACAPRT